MLSKKIFEMDMGTALKTELEQKNMSIKELAEKAKIPPSTLYKVVSGERDPRFSTIKRIIEVFEPKNGFIAVIAAKFLLNEINTTEIKISDKKYKVREYTANSMEECIISAVRAEKEGASGIICAPILASTIEKIVDVPIVIMKPREDVFKDALETMMRKLLLKTRR
jgi:predicted transcriptional regulator